jgi:L-sorbose 1-phosphate reductase
MKTTAVRMYGKNDLRLERFELPPLKEDEIPAKEVCDSLCKSSNKAAIQGRTTSAPLQKTGVNSKNKF